MGIKENTSPEGYVRDISADGEKFEIVVTDVPLAAKPAEVPSTPEKTQQVKNTPTEAKKEL